MSVKLSGSTSHTPCSANTASVRKAAISTMATMVAVSILPTGGRSRRAGRISQLVTRTMASAIGSRKSALTSWNRKRSTNASSNSQSSMSTMNRIASMGALPLRTAEFGGELGGTPIRRRDGVGHDGAQARGIEHGERRGGGAALGGHLLAQHRERLVGLSRHACGTVRGRQGQLVRDVVRQPALVRRRLERFHEQKEV